MGGRPKALLQLAGRPLLGHVAARIGPQVDRILISANTPALFSAFGHELIKDTLPGGLGPLAGLLAALEHADSDYVLCVPCDTPLLPQDLVSRMVQAMGSSKADLCTVSDGHRIHPAILLARRSMAQGLKRYLESGQRKVMRWIEGEESVIADFADAPEAFTNLNTPDELKRLNEQLTGASDST